MYRIEERYLNEERRSKKLEIVFKGEGVDTKYLKMNKYRR